MTRFYDCDYRPGDSQYLIARDVIHIGVGDGPNPKNPFNIVAVEQFGFFDPSKRKGYSWWVACRDRDGAFYRNGTMYFSSATSLEIVRERAVSSGYHLVSI